MSQVRSGHTPDAPNPVTYQPEFAEGHSKPETTRRYVQLPDDAMRAAMRWAS